MAGRTMLDEFSVLTLVTSRLESAGIAYMVTPYVDRWAGRLGLLDLLAEVRR